MTAKLRLVVDNSGGNQKIRESIRPLDREVAPSAQFVRQMKLRLLDLKQSTAGPAQAA
jgi:hypothetical protein